MWGHFEPILMREITELVVFIWLHILKNFTRLAVNLRMGSCSRVLRILHYVLFL